MHTRVLAIVAITATLIYGAAHDSHSHKAGKKNKIAYPLSTSDPESGRVKRSKHFYFEGVFSTCKSTGSTVAQMAMRSAETSHLSLYRSHGQEQYISLATALEGSYSAEGIPIPSIISCIDQSKKPGRYRLKDGFKKFDQGLSSLDSSHVLSACVARLHSQFWPPRLYIAHTGDISTIMTDDEGTILYTTHAHTLDNQTERERLTSLGIGSAHDRVLLVTQTGLTRVLGDSKRKQKIAAVADADVIISDPELHRIDLLPCQHAYMIMATSNFWEYMDYKLIAATIATKRKQGMLLPDIINELFAFTYNFGQDDFGVLAAEFSWKTR